jgi:serine/threonine protein kinase
MPAQDIPPPPTSVKDGRRTYKIKSELGRGGFAAVYNAEEQDPGAGKSVAVKVVKSKMSSVLQTKFVVELRIHSKMRHRHIVEFRRAFTADNLTYIVLDLCENGTLKDMLQYRSTLTSPEIRRLILQVCSGLSYIHSRSVIHRDLKLANILLDNEMNPMLSDFGLAAPVFTDEQGAEIRRATLCGTPNYVAPEVLNREQGHSRGADIWALGVLIFVLYTRSMPFSDPGSTKTQQDIFRNVKKGEYDWPARYSRQVPSTAKDVVSLCFVEEDERVTLDSFVNHDFFAKGDIPKHLKDCLRTAPTWLTRSEPVEIARGHSSMKISLVDLLKESGYVAGSESPSSQSSVFHEFIREEKEMRSPTLPLASIYEPQSATKIASTRRSKQTPPPPSVSIFSREEETEDRIRVTTSSMTETLLKPLLNQLDAYLGTREDGYEWPNSLSALPPRIVQWIDYTRRYGVGLVTSSGAIATIFSTGSPSSAVVVEDAVSHCLSGDGRMQYVPRDSQIRFYERNNTASSIRRRTEQGDAYQVHGDGKLDDTGDEYRVARCGKVHTWARFAGYMTTRLSESARLLLSTVKSKKEDGSTLPIIYQRWGNIHVWVWSTMATQWEFSDHTKILISHDGNLLHIWNETRSCMQPTRSIFESNQLENNVVWQIFQDFDFLDKMKFIRSIMKVWMQEKAVGVRGQHKLLYQARDDEKLDWLTAAL